MAGPFDTVTRTGTRFADGTEPLFRLIGRIAFAADEPAFQVALPPPDDGDPPDFAALARRWAAEYAGVLRLSLPQPSRDSGTRPLPTSRRTAPL